MINTIAEKNMKNIRKEFKEKGIFYTTTDLAERLKKYVDFIPKKIYDPTCGQGNLLSVWDDDIEKYGQEIYEDEIEKANARLKNFHGYCGDTLTDDGFKDEKFDLIFANPPFSIKWTPIDDERFNVAGVLPPPSKADYAFLLHILSHLSDDGKAICLEFPGILYRGKREGKIRKWLVDNNYIERVVYIPPNTFVDTAIATCVLVLSKNKETTDIIFEDSEAEIERVVKIEEVKENDYTLSVSTYIINEVEKEPIDIDAVNDNLITLGIEKLFHQIRLQRMLALNIGFDDKTDEYIERLGKALKEFKEEINEN